MSRIVFGIMGTRGDVYPMLAFARGLIERGHQVVFATGETNRASVEALGAEFRPMRPDVVAHGDVSLEQGVSPKKLNAENSLRDTIFPQSETTYRDLLAAGEGCDVMILPMFLEPGLMAAQKLGIRWVVTHVAPGTFNSFYDPPRIPQISLLYPLKRRYSVVPRLLRPLMRLAIRSWWKPLAELREREGFPPLHRSPLLDALDSPYLTLAMFPSCMGATQKDWPQPAVITGVPWYDEEPGEAAREALDFVASGEAPLIASLGSAVSMFRAHFFRSSIEAARLLGKRLLVIAGSDYEKLREQYAGDPQYGTDLFIVRYAPYAAVFPQGCALIVAGSIGPITQGLRAGTPMMVVAEGDFGPDQQDNAVRAERLGVCRWFPIKTITTDRLVQHLRVLLEDPSYRGNAATIREQVLAEQGVKLACDALENLLAQRRAQTGAIA